MVFLFSLILAFSLAWFGAKPIKKHARLFYIGAAVLSILVIVITYSGISFRFPTWIQNYIWPIFANCTFATALFVIVMMTGALPNGSAAIKRLMPIRAELSIIASILTLGHNIGYGKTYFVMLFTAPERLSGNLCLAAICSLIMILIMIPLMITSFPKVRRKMKAKNWKRLQRSAYAFYALIYLHVMLLNSTFLAAGQKKYLFNILFYTVVFTVYAAMRIRKALLKKNPAAAKVVPASAAVLALAVVGGFCLPTFLSNRSTIQTIEADNSNVCTEDHTTKYIGGTYTGTGSGFHGTVTLSVTVSESQIEAIHVVESNDDEPFWTNALALTDIILSQQSTNVDTVAGATFSSKGIIEAVTNALAEASAMEVETTVEKETESLPKTEPAPTETQPIPAETEPAPVETEPTPIETEPAPTETRPIPVETEPVPVETEPTSIETEPAPTETQPIPVETKPVPVETQPTPIETEPASTETQPIPVETKPVPVETQSAPETEANVTYKDGAYFGNGNGYNGNIQVAVMISGGSISSVIVVSKADDQDFWNKALGVIDDVIDAQNTEVDTVTGATYSSKGLLEAIANALEQAKN